MATRGSQARNTAPKEVYEGRVHKWEKRIVQHKKGVVRSEVQLEVLRWIATDELCPELTGPRHPHIKPLKKPIIRQPKPPSEPTGEQAPADQAAAQQPQETPKAPPEGTAGEQAQPPPPPQQQQPETQRVPASSAG
ncbi:hypothetical protein Agub_g2139, partial [Astrephomene gubernaculifera]